MKKSKRIIALMMASIMVLGLTACGKKAETTAKTDEPTVETAVDTSTEATVEPTAAPVVVQDVALKVWAAQEEQELLAKMCENFKVAHPEYNLTFTYGVVSESGASNELTKDPSVGADVFAFASDQTAPLVAAGLLYPITVDADAIIAANTETSIQAATIDGQLYGNPYTPNAWFMYYDKSKYTEEEVLSMDTMLAKDLGAGVQNISLDLDNSWYISSFFFAAGCTLFGADGIDPTDCTFNNAGGVAAGKFLVDLAANKRFLDENNANMIAAMKEGKLAAACTGTWNAAQIKEALGDNYAATKLPTINLDGKDCQMSNFADIKLIGVNSFTAFPIPAMQLAEYLAGKECQKLRFEVRDFAPTNIELASDPDVLANVAVSALTLQATFSTLQSSIPQMANYWSPAQAFGAMVLSGDIQKDDVQAKLDEMVTNILATIG